MVGRRWCRWRWPEVEEELEGAAEFASAEVEIGGMLKRRATHKGPMARMSRRKATRMPKSEIGKPPDHALPPLGGVPPAGKDAPRPPGGRVRRGVGNVRGASVGRLGNLAATGGGSGRFWLGMTKGFGDGDGLAWEAFDEVFGLGGIDAGEDGGAAGGGELGGGEGAGEVGGQEELDTVGDFGAGVLGEGGAEGGRDGGAVGGQGGGGAFASW